MNGDWVTVSVGSGTPPSPNQRRHDLSATFAYFHQNGKSRLCLFTGSLWNLAHLTLPQLWFYCLLWFISGNLLTLLSLFKTPAEVCLLFTLPVGTNSKVKWLSVCMRSWTPQEKPQATFGERLVGPQLLVALSREGINDRLALSSHLSCVKLLNVKKWFVQFVTVMTELVVI